MCWTEESDSCLCTLLSIISYNIHTFLNVSLKLQLYENSNGCKRARVKYRSKQLQELERARANCEKLRYFLKERLP